MDLINVIYDNRHTPSDYERLLGEFIRQGITAYKFWDAIVLKDSVVKSINASHKMIVRWAKENNLSEVTIAEQDVFFTANNAWQHYLKNKPKQYDVYVSATYIMPVSHNKLTGFQLYTVSQKFYDKFLSVPDNEHIDNAICDLRGDYKICYPFAALQRPGFSANNPGEPVNYQAGCGITEADIYRG